MKGIIHACICVLFAYTFTNSGVAHAQCGEMQQLQDENQLLKDIITNLTTGGAEFELKSTKRDSCCDLQGWENQKQCLHNKCVKNCNGPGPWCEFVCWLQHGNFAKMCTNKTSEGSTVGGN